jgi:hypothetical protein
VQEAQPVIQRAQQEHVRKEAFTTILYVSVCLQAALAAVDDAHPVPLIELIWGTTIGLAIAHWFAFHLSARYVAGGEFHEHDAAAGAAQLVGAALVAALATLAVLLLPASVELQVIRLGLAGVIGGIAFAVARSAGAAKVRSILYASVMLLIGLAVALVKNYLLGH